MGADGFDAILAACAAEGQRATSSTGGDSGGNATAAASTPAPRSAASPRSGGGKASAPLEEGGGGGGKRPALPKPSGIVCCARCSSADTKFCYYNNYNVKQPRFYCKGCQRYWTAGGTLRNVPPGAGRRKNKSGGGEEEEEWTAEAAQPARAPQMQPPREGSADGSGTDAEREQPPQRSTRRRTERSRRTAEPAAAAAAPTAAAPLAAAQATAEAERIKLFAASAGMPPAAFFHPSLMMYGPAGFAAAMAAAPGVAGLTAEAAAAASAVMMPWAAMPAAASAHAQRTPGDAAAQAACAASAAMVAAASNKWSGAALPFWAVDPSAAAAWAYGGFSAGVAPGDAAQHAASLSQLTALANAGRPPVPAGVSRPKAMPASAALAGTTLSALGGMADGAAALPASMLHMPVPSLAANPTALLRSLELQRHFGFAKPVAAAPGVGFKRAREEEGGVTTPPEPLRAAPIAQAAQ